MSKVIPNFRPFSHMKVAGLEAQAGARAEEDDKTRKDEEDVESEKEKDEKDQKAKKAEEDKEKEDKEAKAKKAEEDEEARKAESDKEDDDDKKEKEARADERRRIKAILDSEAGVRLPKAAKRLALDGSLSASDAIAMLEAVGEDKAALASGSKLADRMASTPVPALGAGDVQRGSGPTLAEQIVKAGAKARGEA